MKPNELNCVALAAVLFGLATSNAASAATYYVATWGNDANPGTQAQPFRTIDRGVVVAQSGDVVLVNNGTYTPGTLNFQGKNFTLRSLGGSTNCIIDRNSIPFPGAAIY